jgi:hypothetical protein
VQWQRFLGGLDGEVGRAEVVVTEALGISWWEVQGKINHLWNEYARFYAREMDVSPSPRRGVSLAEVGGQPELDD